MIYITLISSIDLDVYLLQRVQIVLLKVSKAPTFIFLKYADFANIFSKDLASELQKHTKINNYTINMIEEYQLSYKPIYSLKQIDIEILKIYIKTHLINDFINILNSLQLPLSFLSKIYMEGFDYVLITIGVSIIS